MVCGFLPDCLAVTAEEPWGDFQEAGAGLEGRRGQAERSGDELREGRVVTAEWDVSWAWLLRSETPTGGTRPGGPALLGN